MADFFQVSDNKPVGRFVERNVFKFSGNDYEVKDDTKPGERQTIIIEPAEVNLKYDKFSLYLNEEGKPNLIPTDYNIVGIFFDTPEWMDEFDIKIGHMNVGPFSCSGGDKFMSSIDDIKTRPIYTSFLSNLYYKSSFNFTPKAEYKLNTVVLPRIKIIVEKNTSDSSHIMVPIQQKILTRHLKDNYEPSCIENYINKHNMKFEGDYAIINNQQLWTKYTNGFEGGVNYKYIF